MDPGGQKSKHSFLNQNWPKMVPSGTNSIFGRKIKKIKFLTKMSPGG